MTAGRIPYWMVAAVILTASGLMGQEARDAEPGTGRNRLRDAVLATRSDIERALEELNALRETQAAERRPLAEQLDARRAEVGELRARSDRMRALRRQGEQEQLALVDQNQALTETCRFVASLLSEYRRSLETRADRAETETWSDTLDRVDRILIENTDFDGLPRVARDLLKLAAAKNNRKFGGMLIDGAAIDDAGIEHAGTFAVFGPASYFCAGDRVIAGTVVTRLGSAAPAVYGEFTEEEKLQVALLAGGKEAVVPIDVTGGDAYRVAQARTSFSEHVMKGGFVMIPLLAIGVLAAILMIWKTLTLSRVRVRPSSRMEAVLVALDGHNAELARSEAAALPEPLRAVLLEGIEHRNAPREHVEEILEERVLASVPRLERHLGLLAVLGGVAPLLGLLGTVTGMIHTFQLVTVFGTGDATLLSGGISEALVTTEFGLAIAIPVLLVHALLSRRVRTIVEQLEAVTARLIDTLKISRAV